MSAVPYTPNCTAIRSDKAIRLILKKIAILCLLALSAMSLGCAALDGNIGNSAATDSGTMLSSNQSSPNTRNSSTTSEQVSERATPSAFKFGEVGSGFVTTGVSNGLHSSPVLAIDESFAGLLKVAAFAVIYDASANTFFGTVENTDQHPMCDVRIDISVSDSRHAQPTYTKNVLTLAGLTLNEHRSFKLSPSESRFNRWIVSIDASDCGQAPAPKTLEADSTAQQNRAVTDAIPSPDTAISDKYNAFYQQMKYDFSFNKAITSFRGTVRNAAARTICGSRIFVAVKSGEDIIHLGPTLPVKLAPGQTQKVVISVVGTNVESYSISPSTTVCS